MTHSDLWGRVLPLHESIRPQKRRCRVCDATYPKPRDTDYTLCPNCLMDPQSTLVLIDAQLVAVRTARDEACERWVARQADLPDGLGGRWSALVAARAQAERHLEHVKRGERQARRVIPAGALAQAEIALAAVLSKIERTRKKDADISQLLSEESAHMIQLDHFHTLRCRWEMARSDLEVATRTEYL
jgi:hypothetical protein